MIGGESDSQIISNQEYFCMTAVKNSISEYKNNEKDNEKWSLYPKNNAFLQSVSKKLILSAVVFQFTPSLPAPSFTFCIQFEKSRFSTALFSVA